MIVPGLFGDFSGSQARVRSFSEPPPGIFSESIAGTNERRIAGTNRRCITGTNWRCTAAFPFLQSLAASKAQRYKKGAYCGTNWRSTASTSQTSFTGCQRFGEWGHWKRGICIELSEIDFQIRDKFATILRTLPLLHETKYRQFCANLARNLRQICATSPSRTPPSRDF